MPRFSSIRLKTQNIFVNRLISWETPVGWIYRPMNVRRFALRFYWFGPGDIIQKMRPSMNFYMPCAIILF